MFAQPDHNNFSFTLDLLHLPFYIARTQISQNTLFRPSLHTQAHTGTHSSQYTSTNPLCLHNTRIPLSNGSSSPLPALHSTMVMQTTNVFLTLARCFIQLSR